MKHRFVVAALALASLSAPLSAIRLPEPAARDHWECVPFARAVSGIQIFGDAHSWWDKAEGHYARGNAPRLGAVLSFMPHGRMELGHVAAVSEIIDARTIRVTHANWSPINGRRGQIERDVQVVDVSPRGDWTSVRVWFAPSQGLGTTAWPTHGFIYPAGRPAAATALSGSKSTPKLTYANVTSFQPGRAKAKAAMPTGRLTYLGKVLKGL